MWNCMMTILSKGQMQSLTHLMLTGAVTFLMLIAFCKGNSSNSPYCRVSRAYEGKPAYVTCHAPENVTNWGYRDELKILKTDLEKRQVVPELVSECWRPRGQDNIRCIAEGDFQFEELLGNTAKIKIPRFTKRNEGFYHCHFGVPPHWSVTTCGLYMSGNEIKCTGGSVMEGDPATVTCHFNSNVRQTEESFVVFYRRFGESEFGKVLACGLYDHFWCPIMRPDYILNETIVSRDVTIHIPAAQKSHAGQYACDTIPRSLVKRTSCFLHVHERTTTRKEITVTSTEPEKTATDKTILTTTTTITTAAATTITTTTTTTTITTNLTLETPYHNTPVDSKEVETSRETEEKETLYIIVIAVLSCLLVTVFLVFLIIFCRYRKKLQNHVRRGSNQSEIPPLSELHNPIRPPRSERSTESEVISWLDQHEATQSSQSPLLHSNIYPSEQLDNLRLQLSNQKSV